MAARTIVLALLMLVITGPGAVPVSADDAGLSITGKALLIGAPLTASAFRAGLPGERGDLIVTFSVLLFAISTAISWSYYGDRATEYLFGPKAIPCCFCPTLRDMLAKIDVEFLMQSAT